jgi:hypothetical protein
VGADALVYYTWSQGFRSGGFNRGLGTTGFSPLYPGPESWQATARAHGGYEPPTIFAPDNLINNEIGWKTGWWGHRLQWNGDIYQEDWNHVQTGALDLASLGNGVVNGGNYRIRGIEMSWTALVSNGLTLELAAAWNHSRLIKEAAFSWADGTPINFSLLETATGKPVANRVGTLGSSLSGAPSFQANLHLRYEATFNAFNVFAQLGAVHQSKSLSTTDTSSVDLQDQTTAYTLPSFTSYEGAVGVGTDAWVAQVYGVNLTDERAQLFANYALAYKAVAVTRPRTIGLRFSYKFHGD